MSPAHVFIGPGRQPDGVSNRPTAPLKDADDDPPRDGEDGPENDLTGYPLHLPQEDGRNDDDEQRGGLDQGEDDRDIPQVDGQDSTIDRPRGGQPGQSDPHPGPTRADPVSGIAARSGAK